MTSDEAVVRMIDALEAGPVAYMVVGSLASNFHGVPRSTRDADFVVSLDGAGLSSLLDRLGPGFIGDPQHGFETVTGTTRQVIRMVDTPFEFELFALSDDPHDRERFSRRLRVALLGRSAAVATAEDMIVTKLRWAVSGRRPKDVDDIRNMIGVQGGRLDWSYIARWATTHGTAHLLGDIRTSLGPGSQEPS
jgi:hypothetical protein